ncbi:precorrin-6A synthase (deacetylating) [Aquihabitans daechungensis]|uniref:precorrin-6A synthase (deacetylating) n=1 Tax=Aquihabitans daechungensis TaxID=1052257 RepID=UPI003BA0810B
MVRHIHVIGIGSGDPRHVTVQGLDAIAGSDAFLVVDKGASGADLADVRRQILDVHRPDGRYRWIDVPEVPRDRAPADYSGEVRSWHEQRADRFEAALRDDVGEDETAAVLVWGDPALYDSTLRILDDVAARNTVPFTRSVVPGITSVAALAAAHQIPLHRIGEPMLITTGRRLVAEDGWPASVPNAIVMLDGDCSFRHLVGRPDAAGAHIWWGAYVGSPGEILIAGPLAEVSETIEQVRAAAKDERGWIMDLYLLRRPG